MATLEGGVSGVLAGTDVQAAASMHVTVRPIPVGALGHYRTSHRAAIVASQAANSRLFEIRNANASNLVVINRVAVKIVQTAAHTAAIETSLDAFRVTSFSVTDTTNTVTLVASKLRTSFGNAVATDTILRGVTVAGAAAGMTGGALTKDTAPLFQVPIFLQATVPTAGPTVTSVIDWQPAPQESPLILVQNEGLIIENRVLLGAAAGSTVYIDVEWAEVTAY